MQVQRAAVLYWCSHFLPCFQITLGGRKSLMSNHLFTKIHCFLLAEQLVPGKLHKKSVYELLQNTDGENVRAPWCSTGNGGPRPRAFYLDLKYPPVSSRASLSLLCLWGEVVPSWGLWRPGWGRPVQGTLCWLVSSTAHLVLVWLSPSFHLWV